MMKPLSETEPLSLMISSRCKDPIPYQDGARTMDVLRRDMKARLEKIRLGGKPVFKVWIHEDESASGAELGTWETCLAKARAADVFLVLYNGRAGWLGTDSPVKDGVGICHAELSAAYDRAPVKVRSIQFSKPVAAAPGSPDDKFQKQFGVLRIPGAQVETGEEALARADELAAAIVLGLARAGVGVNTTGGYYAGEALRWSRMNFSDRRKSMTDAVVALLRGRNGTSGEQPADNVAAVRFQGADLGFVCDSIPASMSTASARELVGQPFLRDHELIRSWSPTLCGPVHVIACQKGVTEAQAVRQLGFPDAIVVKAPFGIYVADEVQKIQMAFIANCRDEATTQDRVQAFLDWLTAQDEAQYLVQRARDRRRIGDLLRELGAAPAAAAPRRRVR